jgi:hypothetical protein
MKSVLTILGFLVEAAGLGKATYTTSPKTYLTEDSAYIHALSALKASTSELPAEVLLGIVWVESRYSTNAVSRLEDGKRITGIPNWITPPLGTHSLFCGATQVSAGDSWEKCRRFRNISLAYFTLVEELNRWLNVCHHNLACALTGYNGGFQAIKANSTNYVNIVMWRVKLLKEALHRKGHRE